jgi:cardiolipin synthase
MMPRPQKPSAAWGRVRVLLVLGWVLELPGCATSHGKRIGYHYNPAYGVASAQFERTLMGQASGLLEGNSARLLNNGDAFFPAILAAIRGARHSVNVELYIFAKGRIGAEVTEALCAKAREGVAVRVLVDAIGSRTGGLDRRMIAAGVKFRRYKPVTIPTITKTGDRTHRKIVTVDGRIGFTGGFAVDDRWRGDARHPDEWRDVVVEVEGPVVHQLQRAFCENWLYATGEVMDGPEQFPVLPPVGDLKAQVAGSSRTSQLSLAKLHYYLPVQAARERIWIANAYFLPDRDFRRALGAAARRGVDVRLLLPGRHTDLKAVRYASRYDYRPLLEAGVKVFEYRPTMMHSKVMVIDSQWTSIGSINFTARSMKAQAEANLAIYHGGFARQVEAVLEADFGQSDRLDLSAWQQRGLCDRLKETYFRVYKDIF